MTIRERLYALRDEGYAVFQSKLTPGIAPEKFIGVRVPELRKLAGELKNTPEAEAFLQSLPHEFYDENMLHGLLLSAMRDHAGCMEALCAFLPYVDNWAVCDVMSPKVFGKHRDELMPMILRWTADEHEYTCRFGLGMLMTHFLDEDFRPEYLEIPAGIRREEYYVRMMAAWLFATALAKQWNAAVRYLEEGRLDPWTHNKTIRKAIESYRITDEQKAYLRTLKRK